MSHRNRAVAAISIGLLGIGIGTFIWRADDLSAPKVSKNQRSKGPVTSILPDPASNGPAVISIRAGGGNDPELVVSLEEVCLRRADGVEAISKLEPAATPATLAARLKEFPAELEALPIAYPANEAPSENNRRIVTRDLRVQLPDAEAENIARSNQLEIKERPDYAPGWVIMSAADPLAALAVADALKNTPAVAQADVLLAKRQFRRAMPNDTLIGSQWHLKKTSSSTTGTDVNIENAWKYGLADGVKGTGIRIGIVDDGLQTAHPDLSPNYEAANSWDWNGNDSNPNPSLTDDVHGTACAGVAAARGNNGLGVSGAAPEATLVGMRLISGNITDSQEASAMNWRNDVIDIKSNSWGPADSGNLLEAPGPLTLAAFANATTNGRGGKGTVFVWAGGNGKENGDNSNYDGYANSIYTIGVGATDSSGNSSDYSESGANILICAPSSGSLGVVTTDRTGNDGYNSAGTSGELSDRNYTNDFGGTSSATPVISGIVALMLEKNPELGWRDVQEILFRSAKKFRPSDSGWRTNGAGFAFNPKFGGGLADATAAVDLAGTWTNLPEHTSLSVSQNGSTPIPENNATGASRSFVFSASNHRVEHVTVQLSATHTSRGNLAITLTSPSGMVSQLSEVHSDSNDHYTNWTFSSVQHWGETAVGTWTLRVADRSSSGNTAGGTLGNATVTLFGSTLPPTNPPPVVQIASPTDGQAFSPGAEVTVQVNASDLTVDGSEGTIDSVELVVDDVVVGTLTSPPYEFSISPALGGHSLVARATDSEGLTGVSSTVAITLGDRPPIISEVRLSATGQAFADEELTISGIDAADPEDGPVIYTYQWQSSNDAVNFTNATGQTSDTLPALPANAGNLWRCLVTASDGLNASAPFASPVVNLLARPQIVAEAGTTYSYTSGLVLRGVQQTLSRRAIINEFSQGSAAQENREWVELLVMQQGSLTGYQLRDATNAQLTFNTNALWSNVPAGTLIVIYNSTARDTILPADDFDVADGRLVISSANTTYLSGGTWIALGNSGDSITLTDGTSSIHAVSYGNVNSALNVGAVGGGRAAYFSGDSDAGADLLANWVNASASAGSATPGAANGTANQAFITKLRTNTLFTPSVFRIGSGSNIPDGLTLDEATGTISGTIAAETPLGEYPIIIERYNPLGEVVSQTYTLTIAPADFAAWIESFDAADSTTNADNDGDGVPNLVEYLLNSDPETPDQPITFASDAESASVTFRQWKIPTDATLIAEWSSTLETGSWQSDGMETEVIEEDDQSKLLKVSLVIDPSAPKKFLRLRAVSEP